MDCAISGFIDIIPRDVMLIVYKYIWRDNYNRCVEEYTRIYGSHYIEIAQGDEFHYFDDCDNRDSDAVCPIMTKAHGELSCCPSAMFRDVLEDYSYIYRIAPIGLLYSEVAPLPKNY